MSAVSAVTFLWSRSVQNWVRVQARRLKNPRYVVAAAAGAFYFYMLFLRRLSGPVTEGAPSPEAMVLLEAAFTGGIIVTALLSWIFIAKGQGLPRFTEAELQYLFTAPLTRRTVLQIRVLKSLLRTWLSAAIATVFFRRAWGANPVALAVGAWLSFSTLSLYGFGGGLLRETVVQHGRAGWRRSWPALLVGTLAAGAVTYWALFVPHAPPPPLVPSDGALAEWARWVGGVMGSPPLSYVLWPVRAVVRVSLASSWRELVLRLPAALAVVGVLYLWVISSSVAFEESALEFASMLARLMDARRRARAGIRVPGKVKSSRLPLPRRGPAWIAITWKNLISARRVSGPVFGVMLISSALTLVVLIAVRRANHGEGPVIALVVAGIAAAFAAFTAVMGPIMLSSDLRQDMHMSDVLRTLPLQGRQVVLGEVLAPAMVLAALQWVLWLVAVACAWGHPVPELVEGQRAAMVLGAMVFGPALSFAGLCVQNAGSIFFPAWTTGEARAMGRGFEAVGQRLLTMVGTVLVLTVGLVPAALVGGTAGLGANLLVGSWGLFVGATTAAAVVVVEGLLVIQVLGGAFDRIDLTE